MTRTHCDTGIVARASRPWSRVGHASCPDLEAIPPFDSGLRRLKGLFQGEALVGRGDIDERRAGRDRLAGTGVVLKVLALGVTGGDDEDTGLLVEVEEGLANEGPVLGDVEFFDADAGVGSAAEHAVEEADHPRAEELRGDAQAADHIRGHHAGSAGTEEFRAGAGGVELGGDLERPIEFLGGEDEVEVFLVVVQAGDQGAGFLDAGLEEHLVVGGIPFQGRERGDSLTEGFEGAGAVVDDDEGALGLVEFLGGEDADILDAADNVVLVHFLDPLQVLLIEEVFLEAALDEEGGEVGDGVGDRDHGGEDHYDVEDGQSCAALGIEQVCIADGGDADDDHVEAAEEGDVALFRATEDVEELRRNEDEEQ